MFQHRDNFHDPHVNPYLIRNAELIVRHFRGWVLHKDLFLSLAPIPVTHYLRLCGMLQILGHLCGLLRNTLLIHTDVYILFVLLIPPIPHGVIVGLYVLVWLVR